MRRTISRRDGTHDDRCADFTALGCTVLDVHSAGIPGLPDLIVGCVGLNHLVEVKDESTAYGRAGLSENQTAFAREWNGGPVHIAATRDDCLALVQRWRAQAWTR